MSRKYNPCGKWLPTTKMRKRHFCWGYGMPEWMNIGNRTSDGASSTSFKKAIRWLTQAGEQGLAKAWYALSLIYQKAEFSQRNMADAQHYLEIAANLGHPRAQYERGLHAWRNRREDESNDILAVYWLQKAVSNGENGSGTGIEQDRNPGQTGIVGPDRPAISDA